MVSGGIYLPDSVLLLAAMLLCAAEFITGFALITGHLYRYGVIGYTLLMLFFTPLTLLIAIFNPVTDCGCFGDAIHMTNWQTFIKNVILLVPAAIMVLSLRENRRVGISGRSTAITLTATTMFALFMVYNIRQLPLIDFRPYKTGTNIPEAMTIPPDAPQAKFDIKLIYERNGEKREFTLENYPANDTSWKFIDQKSVEIEKGFEPEITSFTLFSSDGSDITDNILYQPGYSFIMISHKLEKANKNELTRGLEFGATALEAGIPFHIITSSVGDVIESYLGKQEYLLADEVLLKTIIRSNPGYLLLKDGTILAKWSPARLPENEWITSSLTGKVLKELTGYRQAVILTVFLLIYLLAVMITDYIFRKLPEKEE